MKKFLFYLIFQLCSLAAFAQYWANTSTALYSPLSASSYVGIGTIPSYKLDVNGKLCLRPTETVSGLEVSHLTWTGHILNMGTSAGVYAHNYLDLKPGGSSSGPLYSLFRMYTAMGTNNQVERIHLTTYGHCWVNCGGYFGIGTTNPNYTLDVNGTIRANEIIVNTSGADFVFEEGYELMPLGTLSEYVKKNHHLPEIQSAEDMQKDGVCVSELQTHLLQKVEELTLYILQQQEVIDELKSEINELKK